MVRKNNEKNGFLVEIPSPSLSGYWLLNFTTRPFYGIYVTAVNSKLETKSKQTKPNCTEIIIFFYVKLIGVIQLIIFVWAMKLLDLINKSPVYAPLFFFFCQLICLFLFIINNRRQKLYRVRQIIFFLKNAYWIFSQISFFIWTYNPFG